MHWPSYDRTTWGLVIGIVALILAFPLSLLANIVTPSIKNWWAERSVKSLKKRIVKLEAEFSRMKTFPMFSWMQYHTFHSMMNLAKLLAMSVHILIGAALLPTIVSWHLQFGIKDGLAMVLLMMNVLNYWVVMGTTRDFIRRSSPPARRNLEIAIIKLKKELDRRHRPASS